MINITSCKEYKNADKCDADKHCMWDKGACTKKVIKPIQIETPVQITQKTIETIQPWDITIEKSISFNHLVLPSITETIDSVPKWTSIDSSKKFSDFLKSKPYKVFPRYSQTFKETAFNRKTKLDVRQDHNAVFFDSKYILNNLEWMEKCEKKMDNMDIITTFSSFKTLISDFRFNEYLEKGTYQVSTYYDTILPQVLFREFKRDENMSTTEYLLQGKNSPKVSNMKMLSNEIDNLLTRVRIFLKEAPPIESNITCYGVINEGPVIVASFTFNDYDLRGTCSHIYKLPKGMKALSIYLQNRFVCIMFENENLEVRKELRRIYTDFNTKVTEMEVKIISPKKDNYKSEMYNPRVIIKDDVGVSESKCKITTTRKMNMKFVAVKRFTLENVEKTAFQSNTAIMDSYPEEYVLNDLYDNNNKRKYLAQYGLISNLDSILANKNWFERQYEYYKGLTFRQKYNVQNYTFHADVIANNYLRGSFSVNPSLDMNVLIYQAMDVLRSADKKNSKGSLKTRMPSMKLKIS
jgi:hypothetical protein